VWSPLSTDTNHAVEKVASADDRDTALVDRLAGEVLTSAGPQTALRIDTCWRVCDHDAFSRTLSRG
jgi:hypothetical protein